MLCFVEENRQNRAPVRAIFRLDGGFGSGENVAWLIEMGYEVYSQGVQQSGNPGTSTTSDGRYGMDPGWRQC